MSPRRSPIEHPVSSHLRQGKQVSSFRRGSGKRKEEKKKKKERTPRKRTILKSAMDFRVYLFGASGDNKQFEVSSTAYGDAIAQGLARAEGTAGIRKIRVRKG